MTMRVKSLLALFIISASTFTFGCSEKTIEDSRLSTRGNEVFAPNESIPFSGKSERYYKSGQLAKSKEWTDGLPNGKHQEWHKNGVKKLEAEYRDGKIINFQTWSVSGVKLTQVQIKDNTLTGENFWTFDLDRPGVQSSRRELIVSNGLIKTDKVKVKKVNNLPDESKYKETKSAVHYKDGYPQKGTVYSEVEDELKRLNLSYEYHDNANTVDIIKKSKDGEFVSKETVEKKSLHGEVVVKNGKLYAQGLVKDVKSGLNVYGIYALDDDSRIDYDYEIFWLSSNNNNGWSIKITSDGNSEFYSCQVEGEFYYLEEDLSSCINVSVA